MSKERDIPDLPKEFRGCSWDEGWEFDGPKVLYFPWNHRAYSEVYDVESLVEKACQAILDGDGTTEENNKSLDEEMKARKWDRRFGRRKKATHETFFVGWFEDHEGQLGFNVKKT